MRQKVVPSTKPKKAVKLKRTALYCTAADPAIAPQARMGDYSAHDCKGLCSGQISTVQCREGAMHSSCILQVGILQAGLTDGYRQYATCMDEHVVSQLSCQTL